MSSGNLSRSSHPELFTWSSELDPAKYLFATYRISATCDIEDAAHGMAMEQGVSTVSIPGFVEPDTLGGSTIRVCSIAKAGPLPEGPLATFSLATEVYSVQNKGTDSNHSWDIELAFPRHLLAARPSQILNILVGELPRLGFLTSFRLIKATLTPEFGPGPAFGVAGIRGLLGNPRGPLLCRAMRPGVGLDIPTMGRLHQEVLTGGFHLVKDDELACFVDDEAFREHLRVMLRARDVAQDRTGEKKLFIANLICETGELDARWKIANELGVDAVMVAPFIQGLGVLPYLARQSALPVLVHNTFSDLFLRHASWGLTNAVVGSWLRQLGADWFVTPGPFASPSYTAAETSELTQAAFSPREGIRPCMPIVQGGKNPAGLPGYRAAVGCDDFMLIVASWVDGHPQGLAVAAREFREQVEN